MADKNYLLQFTMSDGTEKQVPFSVPNPVKGVDYYTDEDRAEIVKAVLANFTDVSEVAL